MLKILDPLCEKIAVIGGNTSRIEVISERVEVRDIVVGLHYVAAKKANRLFSTSLEGQMYFDTDKNQRRTGERPSRCRLGTFLYGQSFLFCTSNQFEGLEKSDD